MKQLSMTNLHHSLIFKSMYISALFFVAVFLHGNCWATEYDVGGGNNNFSKMSDLTTSVTLEAGDIVNIYPGTYTDPWSLRNAYGKENSPINIRGVNADGQPITSPQETVVFDFASLKFPFDRENGAIQFRSGSWIVLEGLAMKNLTQGGISHGMNVIMTWAKNTTFRYLLFKDNVQSFSAKGGSVKATIEYCEFSGGADTTQFIHNIYSTGDHLVIKYSYFHDYLNKGGAVIKSRDSKIEALYNYIDMGEADKAFDLCQEASLAPHDAIIMGNIVVKPAETTDTYTQSFIRHAGDSLTTPRVGNLKAYNNTFIDLHGSVAYAFLAYAGDGYTNDFRNNVLYGVDIAVTYSDNTDVLVGNNNWIVSSAVIDPVKVNFTGTIQGADPGFTASGNYNLAQTSELINAGDNSIIPQPEYMFPDIPRTTIGNIDIGAYEYGSQSQSITIQSISVQ